MRTRYLVVDDDRTNNVICRLTINKFEKEADIHLFTEPEESLEWIQQNYPTEEEGEQTIILLDINMPAMTGWEFLDEFRNLDEEIKSGFRIYMLSSSIEDFSGKALKYPFVSGFLSKPLTTSHLEEIIKQGKDSVVPVRKDF